jgi:hypothetical protein
MTCACGREALDQKGAYFCISCGKHCVHCSCVRASDVPVPDRREPPPDGLLLWSEH